ncbi:hypothetical protein ABPG75_004706 [Micractinium tetrahymenae]
MRRSLQASRLTCVHCSDCCTGLKQRARTAAKPRAQRLRHALTAALALLSALSCYYAFSTCKPKPEAQLMLDGGAALEGRAQGGIYVWDPAVEMPGLPPCDHEDPTSLAPIVKHLVLRRFPKLAECHEEYQYASAWYLERALLRAHAQLARSVDSADAVLIASSCYYEAAFWSRLFTMFPPEELERLKLEMGLAADPERLMSGILDLVPAYVPPEKAVLFFPAPYNAGCNGTHKWMARARTFAGEKQASCGPAERTTVVPFNGNSPDVPAEVSFDNRTILATYIGGGDGAEHRSAGQRLRHYVTQQLANDSDAFMQGTCQGCPGQLSHAQAMHIYQTSTFCLVLAGDAPSSRRATEVVLHGCLPVYVGPPYNSAPFGSVLDYSKFSLVVHVNDTSGWVSTPTHQRQADRWTSEAGPPTHTIADMSQLLPALRSVSPERVREMQAALQRVRRAFLWKSVLSPEQPAAADVALRLILPSYQLDTSQLLA